MAEDNAVDLAGAIPKVLNHARASHLLSRGLREVAKAIESEKAEVVFIAKKCDDPAYKDLIEALCKDKAIPYLFIDDSPMTLGEWCGLVRYSRRPAAKGDANADADGMKLEKVKAIKCSSCAIVKGGLKAGAPETVAVLGALGVSAK